MAVGVPRCCWGLSANTGGPYMAVRVPASTGDPGQCCHPSWCWRYQILLEAPTQCWSPWLVLGVLICGPTFVVLEALGGLQIEVPAGIGVQLMFMSWMMFCFPSQHWGPRSHCGGTGGIRVSPTHTGCPPCAMGPCPALGTPSNVGHPGQSWKFPKFAGGSQLILGFPTGFGCL